MKTIQKLDEVQTASGTLILAMRGLGNPVLLACPKNLYYEDILAGSNEFSYNHIVTNIINNVVFTHSSVYFLKDDVVSSVVKKFEVQFDTTNDSRKLLHSLTELWRTASTVMHAEVLSDIMITSYERVLPKAHGADNIQYYIITGVKTGGFGPAMEVRCLQVVAYAEDRTFDISYHEMDPNVVSVVVLLTRKVDDCEDKEVDPDPNVPGLQNMATIGSA